ncbi:AAA family ATPase [Sphingomonas agri]|uniref:AAA family ATPase n=1 Tax=Sphingomonas agri TaxID=1813878 RepID=UPI00311D8026
MRDLDDDEPAGPQPFGPIEEKASGERALRNAAPSARATGVLQVEWAEEIEPHLNSLWLIKKTLPQQGLALIYGHPGSGKSFLAIDFAMHVALGWNWNGLRTRRGVVVYVAAEGQKGLRNRIVAFKRHYGLAGPIPLALIPTPIDLYNSAADQAALCDAVRAAAARYEEPPALIVVDTISKTIGAGKENTDDLAVYVANCGALASAFECCVIPVHHRPKDAESTEPRGHGSLKGGMDTVILVEGGKPKRARITKQKDDEERELLLFNLQPIELGSDDDGDAVSSCVITPTLDRFVEESPVARKLGKLSPNYRVVYDQLGKAIEAAGVAPPAGIPADLLGRFVGKVVHLSVFSDRAISALRTAADTQPDSARKTFNRARSKLQAIGLIGVFDQFAWLAA